MTPSELSVFLGLDDNICELRTIKQMEFNEFMLCLGLDFYADLADAQADYSTAIEYNNATAYIVNDVVIYNSLYYKSLEAQTGVIPSTKNKWVLADKFTDADLEYLWCEFLGPYIAQVILNNRLPYIWRSITPQGLVKLKGGEYEHTSREGLSVMQKAVLKDKEITYENLEAYILLCAKEDTYGGAFDNFTALLDDCDECSTGTCGTCASCLEHQQIGYTDEIA